MKAITILLIILIASILILAGVLYSLKPTNKSLQCQPNSSITKTQNSVSYSITFNASKMVGISGTVLIVNNKSYAYSDLPLKVEVPSGSILLYTFQQEVLNSSGFYHLKSISGCNSMQSCVVVATYNFTSVNYGSYLNITLLYKNQTLFFGPEAFRIIPITTPENILINVSGSFISKNKIDVAILNFSEYQSFMENRSSIATSRYYYENTQNASINKTLQQGPYFLVFYNPNATMQTNITITKSIVVK